MYVRCELGQIRVADLNKRTKRLQTTVFSFKTCKGQMYWEWSVYHIVEDLRDHFHTHFLEPLDYVFAKHINGFFFIFS